MKITLPFVGEVRTGSDIAIPKSVTKSLDTLGTIFSVNQAKLSSEKTVSGKLLQANREWVYRNNDAIAQEVSKMGFELYYPILY